MTLEPYQWVLLHHKQTDGIKERRHMEVMKVNTKPPPIPQEQIGQNLILR